MKITFERALEVLEAMGYELEQAEQEPVADPYNGDDGPGFDYEFHEKLKAGLHLMSFDEQKLWNAGWDAAKAFYAAPVRTKDLTDDDLEKTYDEICRNASSSERLLFRYARAVIAADREKNK